MDVYIFEQVSPSLKGPLQLYALHGPMFLFVERLGFSLSPLGLFQIDIGGGIKIVAVFVSAKNTLSRHQPTNPDQEVCQRHLSKTNSQLHQMQATKTISPRRQESRNSAAQTNANKTFSSQRLECLATSLLHHGLQNRIQKPVETWRP